MTAWTKLEKPVPAEHVTQTTATRSWSYAVQLHHAGGLTGCWANFYSPTSNAGRKPPGSGIDCSSTMGHHLDNTNLTPDTLHMQ
eukprot:63359-Amphidinium_carterae.1